LQQQLQSFGNAPSRFDTQAFQQIRGAQAQNLQAEYQGQQKALNEDLARRGLFASSIGGGRLGDLAGQQSRALANLDAELLGRAADTQAADRAQLLSAGQGLAELAGSQDLQQFEANRVGQAAEFEQGLRSAEFGQRQFAEGSDIALRAGQAAQDYEKFTRDQELREAELLGEVGGRGTLAARQQGEQARQFDLEQGLRSTLGLGGLEMQRGDLALRQQTLQQQSQDNVAERTLREKLQTQQLSSQEAQQLQEINARKSLQSQQIGEEARQFGLSLTEQQAARAQQGGFTAQEIANRTREISQQGELEGRRLDLQETQNEAINTLERDKFDADSEFRADQLGLNREELDMRANQIIEDQRLRGLEINNEDAYREAELEARTTQIANEFDISGRQITVDEARIKAQKEIAEADNKAQLARLEAQQTFQGGESGKERTFQQGETALDRQLRERLGLTEATGQVYNVNPATGKLEAVQGATGQTLEARRLGLTEAGLTGTFGGQLTQDALQNAYARAAQLSQTTGLQHTVNPETGAITQGTDSTLDAQLRQGQLTGQFDGKATLDRLQQNLQQAQIMSQITGQQYTVNSSGALVPATTGTAATETARQFDLDRQLREAFGMSDATGFVYDPKTGQMVRSASGAPQETVQGQIARNQTLLSLAQALGGLSQEQIARLFGGGTPAPTPSPSPTSGPGNPTPTPTTPTITGQTTTSPPPGTTNRPFSNWTPAADERGYLTRASIAGTPLESVWDNPQTGVRYRIGGYGVWHDGTGWKFTPVVD
jgi:hypothetical protein